MLCRIVTEDRKIPVSCDYAWLMEHTFTRNGFILVFR